LTADLSDLGTRIPASQTLMRAHWIMRDRFKAADDRRTPGRKRGLRTRYPMFERLSCKMTLLQP
jgi:hypothetical protein